MFRLRDHDSDVTNAATVQSLSPHDKVMHALIWDYMIPCLAAGVVLLLLGLVFALLKSAVRKKWKRPSNERSR